VGGDVISSQVDSDIARYFLEEYLRGKRTNPQWDHRIDGLLKDAGERPLTSDALKIIADQTSVDFSAMLLKLQRLTPTHSWLAEGGITFTAQKVSLSLQSPADELRQATAAPNK
jgi:hypothetical protein